MISKTKKEIIMSYDTDYWDKRLSDKSLSKMSIQQREKLVSDFDNECNEVWFLADDETKKDMEVLLRLASNNIFDNETSDDDFQEEKAIIEKFERVFHSPDLSQKRQVSNLETSARQEVGAKEEVQKVQERTACPDALGSAGDADMRNLCNSSSFVPSKKG